jgi:hypothetical protein
MKVLLNNYTDMRAELLLLSLARALSGEAHPSSGLTAFPEVAEPSTPVP